MPFRLILSTIVLALPLGAQEAPSRAKSEKGLNVRLLAEAAPADLGDVHLESGEEKSPAIALPVNHLSDPLPAPGRELVLKTEGNIPLCKIVLPENGKAFAVILVTAKPAGYKPIVVRTDDPSFKAGDVFFVNRSEKIILGKLGNTPLVLKPGASTRSRPSGAIDNTYYDIAFGTRDETGDRRISASRWPVDEKLRSYIFFFTNAEGLTTFRAVDEYLPTREAGT
jgi:hypothetical protein